MRAKPSTCALLFALCQPLAAVAALPEAGMSMKAVEAQFGQPLRKDAAVGNPPITRWEYSDSVVVFERSTVVHSMNVQRSGSPAPAAKPAPAPAAQPAAPAAPVTPVPATPVPPAASATAAHEAAEADAMSKAAAEKSAAGSVAPGESTPDATPDTAAPPNETYTFDPETGRIIVK